MDRKLASVQKVVSIDEIPGADRIVKIGILGWFMVSQKSNNLMIGDLVVFFEPDSLLPLDNPIFDFLKDPNKPEATHHRLKTIRLKKQISQGLILPLTEALKKINIISGSTLAGVTSFNCLLGDKFHRLIIQEGTDLTELLGIKKWEPDIPAQLQGLIKGNFPWFINKTDECRIQSCPSVLERHKGKKFYISEKLDGASVTFFYIHNQEVANNLHIKPEDLREDGTVFGVCSRNLELKNTEGNAYWKLALKYDIEDKLKRTGRSLAIQGEMYGDGIQKNKLKVPSINLATYNIKDIEHNRFLNFEEVESLCKELDLPMVPILDRDFTLNHTVDQLVIMAIGYSTITDKVWREGIVVRTLIEEEDKDLGRLSFKTINPEFLLKYNE